MKSSDKLSWYVGILAMFAMTSLGAYPGENITLDPVSGDYVITYWDESTEDGQGNPTKPELVKTTFVPATKIAPAIRSRFNMRGESIHYSYSISNGKSAKQAIVSVFIEQVGRVVNEQDVLIKTATESELESAIFSNMAALDGPEDWTGNILRSYSRIAWRADDVRNGGVHAGQTQSGFGFYSLALPGISEVSIRGKGEIFGYGGAGPAEDSAIRQELERLQKNNFISRDVAAPKIAVPNPFDAALLMDRIRAEMLTWPGKQMLDQTYASQLDRYVVAAADAYRRNQPKAGKEHIEALREILKREHKDIDNENDEERDEKLGEKGIDHTTTAQRILIDRLAARVLDFDLRYVLKRAAKDKERD